MATATAGELVQAFRSHHISLDWNHGTRDVSKEELFPIVRAAWLGQELNVQLDVNRYRHSGGMSEWRIYVTSARRAIAEESGYAAEVPLSDVARSKLTAACRPIVLELLESDEYRQARRRAFAHAIRRELLEDAGRSYGLERVRDTLEHLRDELGEEYADELARLVGIAQELADGLEHFPPAD